VLANLLQQFTMRRGRVNPIRNEESPLAVPECPCRAAGYKARWQIIHCRHDLNQSLLGQLAHGLAAKGFGQCGGDVRYRCAGCWAVALAVADVGVGLVESMAQRDHFAVVVVGYRIKQLQFVNALAFLQSH